MFRYLAGLAFSLAPPFDIVANQRLDISLFIFRVVQLVDNVSVVFLVQFEMILF